jgi:hypothetical protein
MVQHLCSLLEEKSCAKSHVIPCHEPCGLPTREYFFEFERGVSEARFPNLLHSQKKTYGQTAMSK